MPSHDVSDRPRIDSRHARRRVTRRSSDRDRANARWIAGFAALGGAAAGCEPTGLLPADVALSALLAALITLSASRARRWSWVALGAGAFAFAGGLWEWRVIAFVSFAVAVGAVVLEERSRAIGAVVGGLAVQALLRLPDMMFHGFSALLVVVVCLPVLLTGYQRARAEERDVIRWVTLATIGLVALIGTAYATAAFLAREHLTTGLDQAQAGLDAARDGNDEEAARLLQAGSDSFGSADSLLNGPLALPARAVPLLGIQAKATGEMAASGHQLLTAASATAATVRYDDLRPTQGQIDLAAVYNSVEPLQASLDALEQADVALGDVADPWLVPPIADPLDDLREEITTTLPEARLAVGAVDAAPLILGANGPRRYVVLLGQPAESRFGGGFIGTWAELTATQGEVDLVDSGTIEELRNAPGAFERTLEEPRQYLERYGRYFPAFNLQKIAASPHFPHVRQAIVDLYPQTGREPISGAIYLDPKGVAALLELSGPVDVEGLAEPLTAENAAEFLTSEIYVQFPDTAERDALLQRAIDALFDALTSRDLPGPRASAEVLAEATAAGNLSFSVTDERPEEFLRTAGINGELSPVPRGGDFIGLRSANAAPNKIDTYLQRALDYDVSVDPATGDLQATATVTLTNTAPASGLPDNVGTNRGIVRGEADALPPGTAIEYVSLYSPHTLRAASRDGRPTAIEQQTELQRNVYSSRVILGPGEQTQITYELDGDFQGDTYRLLVDHQPTALEDEVRLSLSAAPGWRPQGVRGLEPTDEGPLGYQGKPTQDTEVRVEWTRG